MCTQNQHNATSYKQKEKFVIIVVCCLHSIPSFSVDISDAFSMWHELAKKFEKISYCIGTHTVEDHKAEEMYKQVS